MAPHRNRQWTRFGALVVVLAGSGCSPGAPVTTVPATTSGPTQSATDAPPTTPATATSIGLRPGVPRATSSLPDGVYRTQLTADEARRLDPDDPTNAGVWTLTVEHGTFRLDCRAVSDARFDCGKHPSYMPPTVEAGNLHGTGHTVWMVHDEARLVALSGCIPHSWLAEGCGPEGGYHLRWRVVADGALAFDHFVGLGDEAGGPHVNWTAKPWTKIS